VAAARADAGAPWLLVSDPVDSVDPDERKPAARFGLAAGVLYGFLLRRRGQPLRLRSSFLRRRLARPLRAAG